LGSARAAELGETILNWVFKVGLGVNHAIKSEFGIILNKFNHF
jgi:hypothetical protein